MTYQEFMELCHQLERGEITPKEHVALVLKKLRKETHNV